MATGKYILNIVQLACKSSMKNFYLIFLHYNFYVNIASILFSGTFFRKMNMFESNLHRLELYSTNLEDIIEKRTDQLEQERQRSDMLLYGILPRSVRFLGGKYVFEMTPNYCFWCFGSLVQQLLIY